MAIRLLARLPEDLLGLLARDDAAVAQLALGVAPPGVHCAPDAVLDADRHVVVQARRDVLSQLQRHLAHECLGGALQVVAEPQLSIIVVPHRVHFVGRRPAHEPTYRQNCVQRPCRARATALLTGVPRNDCAADWQSTAQTILGSTPRCGTSRTAPATRHCPPRLPRAAPARAHCGRALKALPALPTA
jgi:hypothetical protein